MAANGPTRGAEQRVANTSSARGVTDFAASLDQLRVELPKCRSVSLVVSWFGNELRAGRCRVRPKVEQTYEGRRAFLARGRDFTALCRDPFRRLMVRRSMVERLPMTQ